MWKKALWVYLGLYVVGVIYVIVNSMIQQTGTTGFPFDSLILALVLFIPPAMVALELRGKKAPIFLVVVSLLIIAVPVAGILKFNQMDLATIGKVLIFIPLIAALVYFAWKRLFKK